MSRRHRDEETTPLVSRRTHANGKDSYAESVDEYEDRKTNRRHHPLKKMGKALKGFFSPVGSSSFGCSSKVDVTDQDYYEDSYNDYPFKCSFGTKQQDGIWMNRKDQAGTIMAVTVWLLIIYSGVTVTLLAQHNHLPGFLAMVHCTISALALASHAKTSFTDPGAVPSEAVPVGAKSGSVHHMCSHCQTYKPVNSHHCRICNRCISRMDHHCPWMNNCVGAGNLKHFILFLSYTWTGAAFALLIFLWNYFLCHTDSCSFNVVLMQLVRFMTVLALFAILFTSSMLISVQYGVMTGMGTIDRLKRKANNTLMLSLDEPMALQDIFGIGPYWTWLLPIDPIYDNYDRIMGYSTPQRLLREHECTVASRRSVGGIATATPASMGTSHMETKGYSLV